MDQAQAGEQTEAPPWILVRHRLAAWIESSGLSRTQIAAKIGCDTSYLSQLLSEDPPLRWPGRRIANGIARESAEWSEGVISSEEWDRAEDSFKLKSAAA